MKNKENNINSFTAEQHSAITAFLEEKCVGEVCVSRPDVFDGVGTEVAADMEVTKFEILLSAALKDGLFPGFTTRRGRSGGIHRVGAFDARDASKGVTKSRTQTPVEVDGNLVHATLKAKVLRTYLTEVLGGKESSNGNIKIEDVSFECSDVSAFSKYLNAMGGVSSLAQNTTTQQAV